MVQEGGTYMGDDAYKSLEKKASDNPDGYKKMPEWLRKAHAEAKARRKKQKKT